MTDQDNRDSNQQRDPKHIRLPGFIRDSDIGLGDVIKNVSGALGIRPCGGCERRRVALNKMAILSRRRGQ